MTPEAHSHFAISRLAKRPPVIIIGAHRSGTTATARALELLGLQLGQRLDSHHESKAMQRLHDSYLQKIGAAWHNPAPFLEEMATPEGEQRCAAYLQEHTVREFDALFGYRNNLKGWWLRSRLKSGAAWGWKEPRTTLFGENWLHLFPDAFWVDVVRHPLAVALSIRQRELRFREKGDTPIPGLDRLDYCLRLALLYTEAGDRLGRRASNYRRVRFEALQAEPEKKLEDLATFCGLRPGRARIRQAAGTIRPPSPPSWPPFSEEEEEKLLSSDALVKQLGYELPPHRKEQEI